MTAIFGQDIALNLGTLQPRVAANGELVLTDYAATGVQDIVLALKTYLGSLFYDVGHGSTLPDWIKAENTEAARLSFEAEVRRVLRADPRVVTGSETCSVESWTPEGITARATFTFIGEDHEQNLVLSLDAKTSKINTVVADVDPDSASL